jgi:hypothetical protein
VTQLKLLMPPLTAVMATLRAMRYFFKPKVTLNYPFERGRSRPAFAASTDPHVGKARRRGGTLPGLLLIKNGRPWLNTSPAPKSGMRIPSCGEPTTGSNPRTRTKEFGTQRQSQNDLGNQRRLRLTSSRLRAVPVIMWFVLLGAGGITIGFSFLFGTRNAAAQVVMSAALTIALVMLSIMALGQPFAGITRVGPQAFEHIGDMFKRLELTRSR